MKTKLILALTLSVLAANTFAADGYDRTGSAVFTTASAAAASTTFAADGADHVGAGKLAADGADHVGKIQRNTRWRPSTRKVTACQRTSSGRCGCCRRPARALVGHLVQEPGEWSVRLV